MTDEAPRPLTRKQRVFIDEYLRCFSAAEAARRAGYSERTAYAIGPALLKKVEVAAAIEVRLAEVHMSADEALKLTADIARGDVADLFDITPMGWNIDLDKAKAEGKTRLIKKVRQQTIIINGKNEDKEITTQEIELYDAQAALRDILKLHGKMSDKVDVTLTWKDVVEGARKASADDKRDG